MSTNITHAKLLSSVDFKITEDNMKLIRSIFEWTPEICFLDDLEGQDVYTITDVSWCWSGSYASYDTLLNDVFPLTTGYAEIVYIWEGGEWETGVIVQDGVVTRCKVVKTLVPRKS